MHSSGAITGRSCSTSTTADKSERLSAEECETLLSLSSEPEVFRIGKYNSCMEGRTEGSGRAETKFGAPAPPSITTAKKPELTDLENTRVLQRKLVYVVGLSPNISTEETLSGAAFFGQYGRIRKCVVNKNNAYKHGASGYSYGAYVTFENEDEAAKCIAVRYKQAVDGFVYEGRTLKATLGTTKYCLYFLRNAKCPKQDCLFLHYLASEHDSFKREQITNAVVLQPNSSTLTISVVHPDGVTSVFPPIATHRRKSEDSGDESPYLSPQRHMSLDNPLQRPIRKNSRYDFATQAEDEVPPPSELLNYGRLLTDDSTPISELHEATIKPLLADNSPDKEWVRYVVNPRERSKSSAEDTQDSEIYLMRGRSSTTHDVI